MRRRRHTAGYAAITAAVLLLLLWLFCLPADLFEKTPYSTVVTAGNGELLGARVAADGQWRFPPCDSVPGKFARALVEYEDRSFHTHRGISLRGIGRALIRNVANGRVVSGGSTISMQVIRLHRRGPRTFVEKIIEMFMATRLEVRYSKDEILKLYASHAPFGGNVVGIDAAVWRYLGHDGNEMSWAEAAMLAVLPNAPSAIHLAKNRDKLLAKRNRLLKRLCEIGEISPDEYELAVCEPLTDTPYPMPQSAPHLVEYFHTVRPGRRSATHIDHALQQRLEETTARWRSELSLSGINDLAAVIADVGSGEVIAYCGNADIRARRDGAWVDVARAPRSSGSILKPLLYCAALQEGVILPRTLLPDIPADFGGFSPRNFDGDFTGVVPADRALALSLNVPHVHLLKEYGVDRFASLLRQAGFSTLTRPAGRYGLSLVLGGAEVTLYDVVMCYTKIARGEKSGPWNDPVAVYAMLDAMREVTRPDELDRNRVSSVQHIAWKTGTSYGARDGWAVGITPRHVVGVWVGNADGSGVADLTGARTAGPVMFDLFNLLPSCGWFAEPQGRQARVCVHSGHLAGKFCADTRLQTVSESALRSRTCPYCMRIPVSLDGQRRVADCSEPMELRSFFILPPVHKHFYKLHHADYTEPPAGNEGQTDAMQFIYPAPGAVIALPQKLDGTRSELICKATHSDPAAELFWHLDQHFVGSTTDLHRISLPLSSGVHRITVVDRTGAQISREVIIK